MEPKKIYGLKQSIRNAYGADFRFPGNAGNESCAQKILGNNKFTPLQKLEEAESAGELGRTTPVLKFDLSSPREVGTQEVPSEMLNRVGALESRVDARPVQRIVQRKDRGRAHGESMHPAPTTEPKLSAYRLATT